MRDRRVLAVPVGAATVAAVVVATDWPLGLLSSFWSEHALLGGVVSGLVLLLLGTIAVERLLAYMDSKRWRRTAHIAFRALAAVQLDLFQILALLVSGRRGEVEVLEHQEEWFEPDIERLLDRANVARGASVRDALAVLVLDPEWCLEAYKVLRWLRNTTYESIATWAPVTMMTDDLKLRLDIVVDTAAHTDVLRADVMEVGRSGQPPSPERAEKMIEDWLRTMRLTLEGRDHLMRDAGRDGFESSQLHHLAR